MNIAFDSYKQKLNEIKPALEGLAESLNIEGLRNELERLHAMQEAPGFWDNPEKSQQIVMKTKQAQNCGNDDFLHSVQCFVFAGVKIRKKVQSGCF